MNCALLQVTMNIVGAKSPQQNRDSGFTGRQNRCKHLFLK